MLLLGSAIIVGAVALNVTDNSSVDIFENISFNNSILENISINYTIQNETINITPIENISLENQSANLTLPEDASLNESIPEISINNLTEKVEKNKNKFNNETEYYLKNIVDKKEKKDFIVKFKDSVDDNKIKKFKSKNKIDKFNLVKIEGNAEDIEDLIEDSKIEFIELEQEVTILGDNIPFNIQNIKADSAWNFSKGSEVKVAVLDTGISLHDDLSIAGGVSVVGDNYYDSNGHGTAVAGIISALLNDEGLVGVSPDGSLYSVKIMQSSNGELSNAISGIEWAIENNISIVSMSFGMETYSQIFKEVLEEAYSNNILLIAASGNNGQDNILYPAKYDNVIAVGSVDENNNLASFSSYGFEQELVAYGVDINSTSLNNQYSVLSGTSLAAPHVAGAAALIKSYNNSLTNEQIRAKLRNDALDLGAVGKDDLYGYGLVQVNLKDFNTTTINESYYYKIYNITKINLTTFEFDSIFWTEGSGTIDDVDFNPGYYYINITYQNNLSKARIYDVLENGSVFLLSVTLIHTDFFQVDGGTDTDNVAWVNDNITVSMTTSISTPEGECYFIDGSSMLKYCYFDNPTHRDECDSDPEMNCASDTICDVNNLIGQRHEILDYTSARSGNSRARVWDDCTFPGSIEQSDTTTYYVVEKKAALCINISHYNVSGWYGTKWIKYHQGNCGSNEQCVTTQNFTTESAYINPCISQSTCTGTIQVITEDRNGNPMQDLLVSRDSVSNKTTNSVGLAEYSLSQTCNQNLEFKVYCSNSSSAQLCGTETAYLRTINDYWGLSFDCSICSGTPDMQIDVDNVRVNKGSSNVTVNISLSGSFSATNINATFKVQGKDGLISRERSQLFNINSGTSFKFLNQTLSFTENDEFLHVYLDTKNIVSESNEKNNYALVPLFKPQISAYLSINTGYAVIDNEIKDFLKLYVTEEPTQLKANVTIAIGLPKKNSIIESKNWFTQKNYQWFFTTTVYYNNKPLGTKPYNGIVGAFRDDYNYIIIGGNDIDGLLAAVKRLVSARNLFFSNFNIQRVKVIEDTDILGIAVADLLRNPSNYPYYNQRGSDAFANVVERILNNNNFEIAIRTVQTLNTTSYNQSTILRLKNVNSDFSQNYKDVVMNNSKPIILAGGAHSNLLRWEEESDSYPTVPIKGIASLLVEKGRDVWEIELTGGQTQDGNQSSPNYNYNDLVDYYWPVLIAGVQKYSTKNVTQYVGHSTGCRVALDSLKNWSLTGKTNAGYYFDPDTGQYLFMNLSNNPIETFIGVGCPGAFNGTSSLINGVRNNQNSVEELQNRGILHPERRDIARRISWIGDLIRNDHPISLNLWSQYVYWILNDTDKQPGQSLSINKSYFIYGVGGINSIGNEQDDGLVTVNDQVAMSSNINSSVKGTFEYKISHGNLIDDTLIKVKIMRLLE